MGLFFYLALTAVVWTVLPWILFWTDDFDFETARNISVMSVLMWAIFLGCLVRLRYIRRRSYVSVGRQQQDFLPECRRESGI